MKRVVPISVATAILFLFSVATGQQTLTLRVVDDYGPIALSKEGVGCFDPLAAIRLHDEFLIGKVSETTKQAFAVGSCVFVKQGIQLDNAQAILIGDKSFMRGDVSTTEVKIYFPKGLMQLESGKNPNERKNGIDLLRSIADNLIIQVSDLETCLREGKTLNARIDEYNARANEYENNKESSSTGFRVGDVQSGPTQSIVRPSSKSKALFREGKLLEDDASVYWKKCGAYKEGINLDKDYMAYYRLTNNAEKS